MQSNQFTKFACWAIAALAFGCGGAEDQDGGGVDPEGDEVELGMTEQAMSMDCLGANKMGVQTSPFNLRRCNITDPSSSVCFFPGSALSFPFNAKLVASAWTAAESSAFASAGSPAVTDIDGTFGTCLTTGGPNRAKFVINGNETTPGAAQIQIKKGSLTSIAPSNRFDTVDFDALVSMKCINSVPLTESYSVFTARCDRWEATVDYKRILTWSATPAIRNRVVANVVRKIYAIGLGLGQDIFLTTSKVSSSVISRTQDQKGYDTPAGSNGEVGWVCNGNRNPPPLDTSGTTLTCR